jgi:CRP-like cAMP-binding protein
MSVERLRAVPIFEKLSQVELGEIEKASKREVFPPERVVFFEGDRSDSLYVILRGSTKVFQTSDEGKERILNTLGPGAFFGEISMLDGGPRSASVKALEETEMLVFHHRDFRECVRRNPELLWKVLEALCANTRRQSDQLLDMTFRDVPYRLLRHLVRLVEKHGVREAGGTRIDIKLSSHDLAGMVGTNPERVSRLLQRLQSDGLLAVGSDDYLVVPDAHALERSLEYVKDWA